MPIVEIVLQTIFCVLLLVLIVFVYRNPIRADKALENSRLECKNLSDELKSAKQSVELAQHDANLYVERLGEYSDAVERIRKLCGKYKYYSNKYKDDFISEVQEIIKEVQ